MMTVHSFFNDVTFSCGFFTRSILKYPSTSAKKTKNEKKTRGTVIVFTDGQLLKNQDKFSLHGKFWLNSRKAPTEKSPNHLITQEWISSSILHIHRMTKRTATRNKILADTIMSMNEYTYPTSLSSVTYVLENSSGTELLAVQLLSQLRLERGHSSSGNVASLVCLEILFLPDLTSHQEVII